jgi:phage tail-like protein
MSRAHVPGLASPHPLGERLPAMYLDDGFVQRLTAALDEVVAPVFSALDNLDAYLDPELAPADFLQWLGAWVGLPLDEGWPEERRRALVAEAAGLYRVRGTARGLAAYLRLLTGAHVEVDETGGTAYSTGAGIPPPGSPNFAMVVRFRPPAGVELDPARLDELVAGAKPAHVFHRVQVLPPPGPQAPAQRPRPAPRPPGQGTPTALPRFDESSTGPEQAREEGEAPPG